MCSQTITVLLVRREKKLIEENASSTNLSQRQVRLKNISVTNTINLDSASFQIIFVSIQKEKKFFLQDPPVTMYTIFRNLPLGTRPTKILGNSPSSWLPPTLR